MDQEGDTDTSSQAEAVEHTVDQLDNSPILEQILGQAFEPMKIFQHKLSSEGLKRGIIGPRDVNIIWERHILNSAAIAPFVDQACAAAGSNRVADVGSGGGFPGLVLAACLPDIEFTLIEPMERRVEWLQEATLETGLSNVRVIRSRAEDLIPKANSKQGVKRNSVKKKKTIETERYRTGSISYQETYNNAFGVVTCRAVAPLTKLAAWTLPLVQPGGQLVALKGRSAQDEIDKALKELKKQGGRNPRVELAPVGEGLENTRVVLVDKV